MTIHSTRRHLLGAFGIGGVALGAAACGSSDPFAEEDGTGGEGGASDSGSGEGGNGGTLAIGSQAYYSNEIIAELFAQVLEAEGFTVDRQFQIGQREVYMPELEAGSLDLRVNNAGVIVTGPAWEQDDAQRRLMFEVNALGTMHGLVAAL